MKCFVLFCCGLWYVSSKWSWVINFPTLLRVSIYFVVRCLIIRHSKNLKPRGWMLTSSYHYQIWHTIQQQSCKACKISEWSDTFKPVTSDFTRFGGKTSSCFVNGGPGSAFIKPDQRNPWIKDQLGNALLSTILHLQLPNLVTVGAKL